MLAVTWDERKHAPLLAKHPYTMSTKWDGVRATWDGSRLKTRGGHPIHAPDEFLNRMPKGALEGELLIGRSRFNEVSGIVRRKDPDPTDWRPVRFMVFDDPASRTPFSETLSSLKKRLPSCGTAKVCVIPQRPVKTAEQVQRAMREEVERGGEGVMLRRTDVPYKRGRSATLIKVKGVLDDEGVVIGYEQGRNRLAGKLGALRCKWAKGKFKGIEFVVGSGLTDAMRRDYKKLFPLGTLVTVDYMSLGPEGKPRHPRLKGIRTDL